jgi:PAS domain S-box-containing protein
MRPLSIRARVTGTMALLVLMGAIEIAIQAYMSGQTAKAFDEQARTAEVQLHQERGAVALSSMQAAHRGFLITRDPEEARAFEERRTAFEAEAAALKNLIVDPEQTERLARIESLAEDWIGSARSVLEEARRGNDASARLTQESAPRFAAIRTEGAAFSRRQAELTAAARRRLQTTSVWLTAVRLLAIVLIIGSLVAANRNVFRPLSALADAARRLAGGDYDTPLPPRRENEVGDLVGAFGEMRDAVHERQAAVDKAHQGLKATHRELLATIDMVPSAILILDRDAGVRLQNRSATHLLGEAPQDATERRAYWQRFVFRSPSGHKLALRNIAPARAIAGAEIDGEELDVERPDGTRVVIVVGAVPLRDDRGEVTGAVVGFQDITRLRELDRVKNEFVAIVSHELRTPLAAIRGSLQLILDADGVPDDDNLDLMQVALKSCDRLVRIVNDMLDISKIEAGKADFRMATIDPLAPARQAVDGVQGVARTAGVEIRIEATAPPSITGDVDKLTQALVNLLSNAVKFSPRGSAIVLAIHEQARAVVFSVTDSGPGIAAEDLGKLFQKFQQLKESATRRTGGTGLGLAITKGIVGEHRGHISVRSEIGKGTTFTFTIPRATQAPAAA